MRLDSGGPGTVFNGVVALCGAGTAGGFSILRSDDGDCSGATIFGTVDSLTIGDPASGKTTTIDGLTGNVTVGTGLNETILDAASGNVTVGGDLEVKSGNTVDFRGNTIQGVGAPGSDTDAANRKYVDDEVAGVSGDVTALSVDVNALDERVTTEVTEIKGSIDDLDERVSKTELDVTTLFERDASQQRQIDGLKKRDDELAEGIAIALSLDAPVFQPGQTFAMRAGWGNFDGSDAFGMTAAGLLDKGSFGPKSTVTLDGGVGFGLQQNTVAGKAGVSFGW